MECENCGSDHNGNYGSGRFCGKACARCFSTRAKRLEINIKVSKKLTGRLISQETRNKLVESWRVGKLNDRRKRQPTPIDQILVENGRFTSKYVKDRIIADGIKPYVCEICGIDEYNDKPITLQLHHCNGVYNDHRIENLQILCPNCHSQTDNYAGKNRSLRKKNQIGSVAESL